MIVIAIAQEEIFSKVQMGWGSRWLLVATAVEGKPS